MHPWLTRIIFLLLSARLIRTRLRINAQFPPGGSHCGKRKLPQAGESCKQDSMKNSARWVLPSADRSSGK